MKKKTSFKRISHRRALQPIDILIEHTFDVMLDIAMLINFAPDSVATAFASIVLPVPGGPKNNIPFTGCQHESGTSMQ
jgi:hypothetical protein